METLGIGLFLLVIMLILLTGGVWIAMTLAICGWVGQAFFTNTSPGNGTGAPVDLVLLPTSVIHSTTGPRLRTGKKVSTPTITMTPTNKAANSGVVTGKVPSDGGTRALAPRLPASASIGTMTRNRPISIATPIVALYQPVLAERPANAEPLLPAAEVKA